MGAFENFQQSLRQRKAAQSALAQRRAAGSGLAALAPASALTPGNVSSALRTYGQASLPPELASVSPLRQARSLQGVIGGTPLARQASGMLGAGLASPPQTGLLASRAPDHPVPPSIPTIGTPGLRQYRPSPYRNHTEHGFDATRPSMFPSNLPKPTLGASPSPEPYMPASAPAFQGPDFGNAARYNTPSLGQPRLSPPGPMDYNQPVNGYAPIYPGATHSQLRQARQADLQAEAHRVSALRRYGLADPQQSTHFHSQFGGSSYGGFQGGASDNNRVRADWVNGGGAPPAAPDPQFAGMNRFLQPQTVDINPFDANVRPVSTKDMDSRNSYGLNRDQSSGMNMRPAVRPDVPIGEGDVVGHYGNSTVVRINGKNTVIGNKSPNYEAVVSGEKSPNQAAQEGVREHTNSYLSGKVAQWGVNPNSPNLNSPVLAANRERFLEQQEQKRTLRSLRSLGASPEAIAQEVGALRKARPAPGQATIAGSITPRNVPTDTARENLAVAGNLRGLLGQLGLPGYQSLSEIPAARLIGAFRHPEFGTISPEGRAAFNTAVNSWMALNPNNPWRDEMTAWLSGDHKRARKLMEDSIAAAEAQNAATGIGEMWP